MGIGVITGLVSAVVMYCFLSGIRDVIRFFPVLWAGEMSTMTSSELLFQNYMVAFISLLFGQGVCIQSWFLKPGNQAPIKHLGLRRVVHDQWNLWWYGISWLVKLGFLYAVLVFWRMYGEFHVSEISPHHGALLCLIVLVLFLNSWLTLVRLFKRKGQIWMMISCCVYGVLSFPLAHINVVNSEKIDQYFADHNTMYHYKMQLSSSSAYKYIYKKTFLFDTYLAKSPIDGKLKISIDHEEFSLEELRDITEMSLLSRQEVLRPYLTFRYFVDNEMPMEMVRKVVVESMKIGVSKVAYAVFPDNQWPHPKYYCSSLLPVSYGWGWFEYDVNNPAPPYSRQESAFQLRIRSDNELVFNGEDVSLSDFRVKLLELTRTDSSRSLDLDYDIQINFEAYIHTISAFMEVKLERRNEISLAEFGKIFEKLEKAEKMIIKKRVPIYLYDVPFQSQR